MEEQQEGGDPSSALGGGSALGPPRQCWVYRLGQAPGCVPRLRLPARKERASGGRWGCSPPVGAGRGAAASGRGPAPLSGLPAPRGLDPSAASLLPTSISLARHSPSAPLVSGGPPATESPLLFLGRPTLAPPPSPAARPGSQRRSAPAFVEVRHQGVPGDAAGPPLPPHTETRSWGSRPWLGAAFSLVLKNLPGETISSDPKT